jgi:excisionase family DNA binding protein
MVLVMKTLTLIEAADFLKMTPEGLRRKASKGDIPGAKPGKCWVFREDDLAEYLRSLYPSIAKALQGVIESSRRKKWRSTKEVTYGGSQLHTKDLAYKNLLGLPTK